MSYRDINILVGLTISSITGMDDSDVTIKTECGKSFRMRHEQDCCETVAIKEVIGSTYDVVGEPVRNAYKTTSDCSGKYESGTRTVFTIGTNSGSLSIVWEGYSNGYYGEGVSFYEDDGNYSRW